MVKIHRCIYCGELPHDSPRKNKNCELRHRSKSSPEVSETRQPVFKSAYFKRLYSLGVIVDDD